MIKTHRGQYRTAQWRFFTDVPLATVNINFLIVVLLRFDGSIYFAHEGKVSHSRNLDFGDANAIKGC